MTNIGIVPPEPGFLEAVRELCDETGTLLVNDETHTFSAGFGGCTRAWGLRPDIVTIGKALGSGIPIGAYGVSADFAERILADADADLVDQGGVGGTLAGNALSLAAARATLEHVLTEENFARMIDLATRYTEGVAGACSPTGACRGPSSRSARAPSTASRSTCRATAASRRRPTTPSSTSTCISTRSTAAS